MRNSQSCATLSTPDRTLVMSRKAVRVRSSALSFTGVMSIVLLVVFSILARTAYALAGIALMLVAYAATLRFHFKLFEAAASWEATHAQAAAQRARQLAAQVPLWFFVAGMPLVLVVGLNLSFL
jgi:Ca2+/Na+ antiporter